MESKQGSLGRAVMRSKHQRGSAGSLFRTLKSGLGSVVNALAKSATVRHAAVDSIERSNGSGYRVRARGETIEASSVIIAAPAWAASGLLRGVEGELSGALAKIPYSSSAIVTLVYDDAKFNGRRAGFGFLVPRSERKRLLAATFVATKFPNRAPDSRVVLRCFFGGMGDDAVLNESDESLVALARGELQRILGLTAEPLYSTVARWPKSMAQYIVGHAVRVQEIEKRAAALPGLYLAGNAYYGIGIPDCIRLGREAAAKAIRNRP